MGENMSEFSSQEKSGLYKAIYTRRDVRSHFISKPLSDEVLARILNAAHHAPSVGFSQPWNFVLIRDDVTKEKIKKSFEQEKIKSASDVDHQKKEKYLSLKLEGILESDVNICITYDPTKFGPFVIGRSSIPETGIYSELLKEALSLPEHIIPIAYLCLGHVSEFAEKPDLENAKWLTRLELKDVIYFEKWGQVSNTDWEEMNGLIRNVLDYPFIK
jgi:5,6-dimethylbenzimidazole synthase